ncbi:MAG: amino acid ABC transporter permease [Desulfovibrionaceae bacterium]|nr:amino acid ABC transporter permease [Desulfovibrionaceae bacterium]
MQSISVVFNSLPAMLAGSLVTLGIVFGALSIGLIFGLFFAVLQVYGKAWQAALVGIYVFLFRGFPIIVLLFLGYGFFVALGLPANPFMISCVVLGCTSTAYQSQIFRGAIMSLRAGQFKAARALGMTDWQAIRYIIIPQALRLSIPGWSNEYSILLKDSAICFVLGTQDIMAKTSFAAARTHEHLALYAAAGLIYFILTLVVVKLLSRLENKLHIPGFTQANGDNNL